MCVCVYLVSQCSLDEAEQDLIGLPGFLGLRLIDNAHHVINSLRQQGETLHLVNVVAIFVSLSTPSHQHTHTLSQGMTVHVLLRLHTLVSINSYMLFEPVAIIED